MILNAQKKHQLAWTVRSSWENGGTEVCIDAVDVAEDDDEPALQSFVSNVDIHIGVDQIGILKSRIQNMMSEGDIKDSFDDIVCENIHRTSFSIIQNDYLSKD